MPNGGHQDVAELAERAWDARERLGARARSEVDRRDGVENVIRAMRERVDRPFTLEQMAGIAYLSPFYFNRVFRRLTGAPPRRFQTALRMAAAKRLLLTTDLSVTEVCLEIGYQSLGTFTTQFHQLVGVSPRDLRRLASLPSLARAEMARLAAPVDAAGSRAVVGAVTGCAEDRLVFVGLFPQPYPQGLPLACTALAGPGRYELRATAEGCFHVAAAAFPLAADGPACLLPDEDSVLVATGAEPVTIDSARAAVRDLRLRPIRTTDPPILLALPLDAAHAIAAPGRAASAVPL
jgi:AraC family transcriptional regulator